MKNQGEYNTNLNDKKYKTDYTDKAPSSPAGNTDAYTYTPDTYQTSKKEEKKIEVEKLVNAVNLIKEEKIEDDWLYDDDEYDQQETYEPIPQVSYMGNDASNLNLQKLLQDKKTKDRKNIKASLIIILIMALFFIIVLLPQKKSEENGFRSLKPEKDLSIEVIKLVEHYKVAFPNVIINTNSTVIDDKEITIYLNRSEGNSSKNHIVKDSYELMLYTIKYVIENNTFIIDKGKNIAVYIRDIEDPGFEFSTYKSDYRILNEIDLYGTEGFSRWKIEFSPYYSIDEIILGIVIDDNGEVIDDFTNKPIDLTPYIEKYDRDITILKEFERKEKIDRLTKPNN